MVVAKLYSSGCRDGLYLIKDRFGDVPGPSEASTLESLPVLPPVEAHYTCYSHIAQGRWPVMYSDCGVYHDPLHATKP